MITFKPLEFEDKSIFDDYFQQRRYEGAECNFTTLYMWRNTYQSEWAIVDDFLCIKISVDNMTYVLPPYGPIDSAIDQPLKKLMTYFEEQGLPFIIRGVSASFREILEARFPDEFVLTEERDSFDYLYLVHDLIKLKGKYHRKRNHVKNFKKLYPDYQYVPLSSELIEPCIANLKDWCEKKGCYEDKSLVCEMDAIIEILERFGHLNYKGGVILIDGKVEAFTLGEVLNNDTVLIHTEKGNTDFKGIYQAINQEFLFQEWQDMIFVNREDDMGIEGLRKAKLSYFPIKLITKYRIEL